MVEGSTVSQGAVQEMIWTEEEEDLSALPCFATVATLGMFFSLFISFFPLSEL